MVGRGAAGGSEGGPRGGVCRLACVEGALAERLVLLHALDVPERVPLADEQLLLERDRLWRSSCEVTGGHRRRRDLVIVGGRGGCGVCGACCFCFSRSLSALAFASRSPSSQFACSSTCGSVKTPSAAESSISAWPTFMWPRERYCGLKSMCEPSTSLLTTPDDMPATNERRQHGNGKPTCMRTHGHRSESPPPQHRRRARGAFATPRARPR